MNPTENYYFLGKCLTLGESWSDRESLIQIIQNQQADWNRFVALASSNLVLPTVYCRFRESGVLPLLPDDLREHLHAIYELNRQRNLEVLNQIDRINTLLSEKQIMPIYLKSAGNILDHLYQDIGERMLGDIDLLVSDEEFLIAVQLLKAAGYDQQSNSYDDFSQIKHYPRLIHPSESLPVEVHRLPVEFKYSALFNYKIIEPEMKIPEHSSSCFVLSDRHKLTMNFFHGFLAVDVKISHWIALRDMVDFILIEKRVAVSELVESQPNHRSDILVYSRLVYHALGKPIKTKIGFRSRKNILRNEWFLNSKFFYQIYWLFSFITKRLIIRNMSVFFGILYSRTKRNSVFRRLGDRQWFKLYIKYYSQYIHRYLLTGQRK